MEPSSVETVEQAGPAGAAIARHYDQLDPYYRDVWGEHVHHGWWLHRGESAATAAANLSRCVLAELNLAPGHRVADIGCGYGATARMGAETAGVHVIGLTLSAAQKAQADTCEVRRGSVEVICADWRDHEFAPGSLDALLALESLEHMADKAEFAAMAWRAVRPGGRLVVTTWLAADHVARWQQRHLLDAICREGRLAPLVTMAELRAGFVAAGWKEVRADDIAAAVSKTWTVVLRRLTWRLATRPSYWRFIFSKDSREAVFALTAIRIRLGYLLGCFRYGFLVWQRPGAGE